MKLHYPVALLNNSAKFKFIRILRLLVRKFQNEAHTQDSYFLMPRFEMGKKNSTVISFGKSCFGGKNTKENKLKANLIGKLF